MRDVNNTLNIYEKSKKNRIFVRDFRGKGFCLEIEWNKNIINS